MIEIASLSKAYIGGGPKAVADISFEVESGTLFTLLGPSGCGKTTTLRCVAGLEKPDAGEIRLGGEPVFSSERQIFVHPSRRQIGMVFQSYAIWPHMTVFQNVAYPLRGRGLSSAEIRARALDALRAVDLAGFEDRPAPKLSGGQQQRVALARAVAAEPKVFLFDEPLSNLDAKLREEMRGYIVNLQRQLGVTALYVTHDQIEALSMSSRIAIMDHGHIVEVGTPRDIYLHPRSRFEAQFVGLTNILPVRMTSSDGSGSARLDASFASLICQQASVETLPSGAKLVMLVRPENIRLSLDPFESSTNAWRGRVESSTFLGECIDCVVRCGDTLIRARVDPFAKFEPGVEVHLHAAPERLSVISE
jgi:iron(III) transport system ATP-binding protein